jgi:hypothetical protein
MHFTRTEFFIFSRRLNMKRPNLSGPPTTRLAALLAAGLLLGMTQQQALAVGTASGTTISNTATMTFSVGGVTQSPQDSNPETFKVDNKIDLTVVTTDVSPGVTVYPGQVAATPQPNPPAYLTFTVTNLGNTTQDFILSPTNPAAGATSPFTGTTEFAVSNCRTFVENNGTAGLQIGSDLEQTYLNDVPATGASSRTVYLVCDSPLGTTNGQDAVAGLVAEAVDAAGSVGSPSSVYTGAQLTAANTKDGVEIVAADGTGSETGDGARDTKFSARSAYSVATTTLSVTKTVTTLCDPFNGSGNGTTIFPKNIPGAVVRWTIAIANTGSVSASLATIADALATPTTTFDPDLITGAGTCEFASGGAGTAESANGRGVRIQNTNARPMLGSPGGTVTSSYFTGASDADGVTLSGTNLAVDFAIALPSGGGYTLGELKAGETITVYFNVGIN